MNRKSTTRAQRVFFGLCPDVKTTTEISKIVQSLQNLAKTTNITNPDNFHLTLHFLGNIPVEQIDCVKSAASKISANKFNLKLTHLGHFKKSKILWLGVAQKPTELLQLHTKLGKKLVACGCQAEIKAFKPHITLVRKVADYKTVKLKSPILWQVDKFALIKSAHKNKTTFYEPIQFFKLNNKAAIIY